MRRSGKLLAFGGRKSKYTTAVKMASGGGAFDQDTRGSLTRSTVTL